MKAAHVITLFLWAFGIVNLLSHSMDGYFICIRNILLLLIAHLIECVVYRNKILKSQDSPLVFFYDSSIWSYILGSIKIPNFGSFRWGNKILEVQWVYGNLHGPQLSQIFSMPQVQLLQLKYWRSWT